jgi:2-(1,2-epoxy-1,2-dihydrophenyl)acetyl-CoA isomerase
MIEVHRDGGAANVVLNRPHRLNAWSISLSAELLPALRELAADDSVRAVALTGTGKAFCVGADLKEGLENVRAHGGRLDTDRVLVEWYNPIVTTIREMPKPVICAVNGAAAGAGASLALSADLVVAAESAYFMLAFAGIGLVPDGGSSLFVPARVGFARAAELAMLGERVPAAQAAAMGLINAAWPDAEFAAKSQELLRRLAAGPTRSYAGTKRELNQWMYGQLPRQLELEAALQREAGASKDFLEGINAFMEKRAPHFTGE